MSKIKNVVVLAILCSAAPAVWAQAPCEPSGDIDYVCGPTNAEDLVLVPGTKWIVASGMAAGVGFSLIDSTTGAWSKLQTGARHDATMYPQCASPPQASEAESHGLNIRAGTGGHSTLYAVGHGSREAIEVYDVDASGARPALTWKGCVAMPDGLAANSVASFADGSLAATVLMMPGKTFADSVAKRPTGAVFEWSPGDKGFTQLGGSELPGNNGIEVSADGRELYVVSSGFQTIVAFSNTNPVRQLRTTKQLPITPDNVHMGPNGRLLTAGMKNDVPECGGPPGPGHDLERLSTCPRGTIAIEIDPATMADRVLTETPANPAFSNATMVLPAAGRYWFGTFSGDRIAYRPQRDFQPVTDAMLQNPPAADWLSFRRTLNAWGYSPLDQINATNVANLTEVWSMPLQGGSMEATPLVHDGIMYLPLPGDRIVALVAATGDELWSYAPSQRSGGTKRNIAMYGDRLISTSAGGTLFAVDARTGVKVWEVPLTGPANTSAGPIIADGKVISGRACAPGAGPEGCVMIANDARTGKELWRTWTIARPGEPANESWGDVPWEERNQVGTWMPPSYDPELNLVYFGTSVTGPTVKYVLAGNDKTYLYHTSTLALDADTGEIRWYYQHIVDQWDFDHTFDRILVDTAVAPDPDEVAWINPNIRPGERRKVLTGIPGKTGIVYTLDRVTGEFLWAEPTVKQTVVSSIDGATGKVHMNPDTIFTHDDQRIDLCPAFTGGKNWMPGAYSPQTGYMYMPLENLCSIVTSAGPKTGPGQLGMRIDYSAYIPPGVTDVGEVRAISVSTGDTVWKAPQRPGSMAVVATGGGLVFNGDAGGGFRALDAKTGKVLWETKFGGAVSGIPVSFGAGGRQYVAVATGSSPEAGGLARLTPDVEVGRESALHVFALD